ARRLRGLRRPAERAHLRDGRERGGGDGGTWPDGRDRGRFQGRAEGARHDHPRPGLRPQSGRRSRDPGPDPLFQRPPSRLPAEHPAPHARHVADADVILESACELEAAWMDPLARNARSGAPLVKLAEAAKLEIAKGDAEEPAGDPHVWQDPTNVQKMVEVIRDT